MASSCDLIVNVSGCVWSSLFLDHASSMGDQEGFLFGEVRKQTNEDISDSQMTRKTEQISINIYSHYACEEPFSFYDRRGHADKVKLLSMLKDNYKHTIGWYRFRRNTVLEPSMREATIHRELLNVLHSDSPNLFLLGLFTSGMSWNQATHFFNHQLLTLGDRGFKWLGVRVINLGDTSHSEYRESASMGTVAKGKGTYSSILNDFRSRIIDYEGSLQGVHVIHRINETVYSKMQVLKNKISKSEQLLQIEIEAVKELQRQKRERERREVQHKMEQQARLAAARPEPTAVTSDVDSPVLQKAVVHHNPPSYQKPPLKPTVAEGLLAPSPTQGSAPHAPAPSLTKHHPPSLATETAPKVELVSPDGSNKDPFAGLFKDMKRSIQKTSSLGEELRPEDSPRSVRAHSWEKSREAELRTMSTKGRAWNSVDYDGRSPLSGSSPVRGDSTSGRESSPQRWNTEDSDDATQLPEYPSSASPTF